MIGRPSLAGEELREVEELASLCNAFEGLDLKLALSGPPPESGREMNRFLYYENGKLIGFCSLDYEELCGMVHPDYRRKGIGKALLVASINEYRRRDITNILIICETASQSGKSFVATTGASYDFAEHHMELLADNDWQVSTRQDDSLTLSKAIPEDIDTLAGLTSASLDRPQEEAKQHILSGIEDPTQQFYIASLAGTPIGTLKTFHMGTRIGIYAFGVLQDYRGLGFGKQILTETIRSLMSEGWTRFALEVETNNTNAIGLYTSCGFKETTTYEYHKLAI